MKIAKQTRSYLFISSFVLLGISTYIYTNVPSSVTKKEIAYVLNVIKFLDTSLYDIIMNVDPTGVNHVKSGASVGVGLADDGLPCIFIPEKAFDGIPFAEACYALAHELGHYVMHHLGDEGRPFHKGLTDRRALAEEAIKRTLPVSFAKGKQVAGQLPMQETFKKAHQRTKEDEADRVAILDFGVSVDAAIDFANRRSVLSGEVYMKQKEKETFKSTHPLWIARRRHLQQLRRELEIKKGAKRTFDWAALAKEYKQKRLAQSKQ